MGILQERVKLSLLVNGNGIAENYKNNCLHLIDRITKSDQDYTAIDVKDIKSGYFYFIQYKDSSNWMKWSPVFQLIGKSLTIK